MKVLIVEDDENKRFQLNQVVYECLPSADIHHSRSLQSGMQWMRSERAAIILLDMTLPTFDVGPGENGGRTHAFGGREFLREMRRFKIVTPVIVVTQFETFGSGAEATSLKALDVELRRQYDGVYQGAVYYHAAIESWKDQLKNLIFRSAEK